MTSAWELNAPCHPAAIARSKASCVRGGQVRAIFSPLPPGTGFYLMPSASRCWPQWLGDVSHAWPGDATREWDSRDLQPDGPPRKATKDARPPTYSREGCLRTKARIFLKYSPSVVATRSGIARRPPPRPAEKNKRYVFFVGGFGLNLHREQFKPMPQER